MIRPRALRPRPYLAYVWARGPSRLLRVGRLRLGRGRARAAGREIRAWSARDRVPELSVCVPTRSRIDLLVPCLRSLAATSSGRRLEVVVADTGRGGPAEGLGRELGVRALSVSDPFNFADACNRMAAVARGRRLLFLNDDTTARTPGWERPLMEAGDEEVIGALLLFPGSDRVQHSGIEAEVGAGPIRHNRYGPRRLSPRSDGLTLSTLGLGRPAHELSANRELEVLAVSGAALSVAAERFRAVGGFDPGYAVDLQDYDLCLRLREHGARVVCRTDLVFSHRGGATRGFYPFPRDDWERFIGRWGELLHETSELAAVA